MKLNQSYKGGNEMKYRNIAMILLLGLFLISFVSADQISTLGTYKQHECVKLKQTCADCTYVNFTRVSAPDSTTKLSNVAAEKDGSLFNHTFCTTGQIGTYIVEGIGDPDGTDTIFAYDFEITPDGFKGTLGFYILFLVLSLGIIIFGISIKDAPITILGSFGLYFIGIYIMFFGITGLKDPTYTWGISLIILGLAFYVSIKSAYELIVD